MIVTGAGPGIMQAGDGGRRSRALASACRIRLPFEQAANPVIAGDDEVRQHEVLLHPQADAGQGERGRSSASRAASARSTRRSSCSPSRRPARACRCRSCCSTRPATRTGRRSTSSSTASWSRRGLVVGPGHAAVLHHRRRRDAAVRGDRQLLRATTTRSATSATCSSIRLRHAPTDEQLAALNEQFGYLCASGRSRRTRAAGARGPRARLASTCRGSPCVSPSTATATCAP